MVKARVGSYFKILGFGVVLAIMSPALCVLAGNGPAPDSDDASPDAVPPTARQPGGHAYGGFGSTFGAPRGGSIEFPSTVIGPGGVIKPPSPVEATRAPARKEPTPEERADRIRKALAPKPPLTVVRRRTLDELYGKLAVARDVEEAKGLATLIGGIWLRSGSDTANLLMQRALLAMDKKDYAVALDLLDRLVDIKPAWAEAWNKRATVRFYQGNLDAAMADVEHVLKLEPKHFGALDGMGAILQRTGFDRQALAVFRRSLAVYPLQPEIKKIVDKLQLQVEGQGI
jgi:hypothetical protein